MKAVLKLFFMLLIFLPVFADLHGQVTDTTKISIPQTWKKYHIGLRVGAGIQKSFYTEVGLSLQKYVYSAKHGYIVPTIYTAFEWIPATSGQKPVYGIKAGVEMVNTGAAGGLEIKYLANSENEDLIFTPRLGFGLGFINFFYGYNLSTRKYPFPKIGKHQFSLVINSNIFFYHLKDKRN